MKTQSIQFVLSSILGLVLVTDHALATSAGFVRTLTRSTSIEGGDRAVYNPAASAQLSGCDAYFSNLSVRRDWDIRSVDGRYDTKVKAPVVPEFNLSCGRDGLGWFVAIFPSGGAAAYGNGLPSYVKEMNTTLKAGIQNQSPNPLLAQPATIVSDPSVRIDARKINAHLQVGGAYALDDHLALSLGLTSIYSRKQVKADLRYSTVRNPSPVRDYSRFGIDYHQDALGFAPIVAMNWADGPWRASLRYEGAVLLNYQTKVIDDDTADIASAAGVEPVVAEGKNYREDKPATLTAGLARAFANTTLRAEASVLFNRASRAELWQHALDHKAVVYNNPNFGAMSQRDNAWTASGSVEQRLSQKLLVSAGVMYGDGGSGEEFNVDEQHVLDAYYYGTGIRYDSSESMSVDLGYLLIDSIDSFNQDQTEVYRMRDQIFALGLNIRG